MDRRLSKALIVGAGIAGPVLAVFLKKQGLAVELYEAATETRDGGGALGLASNGMAVLAAAGVLERVRDVSVSTGEWRFENEKGGVLARVNAESTRATAMLG